MSNRRFVSSLGQPYLAFVADNVGDLSTLPSHGLLSVVFDLRVTALPTQSADPDEVHPFFSFAHDIGTQPAIFEVGVTPSGRLKATTIAGGVWSSPQGLFAANGPWVNIQMNYSSGTGEFEVLLDEYGSPADAAETTAVAGDLVPVSGHNTKLMFFNGRDALSRTSLGMRSALVAFLGAGLNLLQWSFAEGEGNALSPELVLAGEPARVPTTPATAQWYESLFYHPWGAVPEGEPNEAYTWGLETEYTAIARPVTTYTRVSE